MLVVYSLKIKSIHPKYLSLGVLTFLELLKKKEQVVILGIGKKTNKKKVYKYTVLKSPFINKNSREQFKLQVHSAVIFFSVVVGRDSLYLETFVECLLLKYLSSQYLEIKLVKQYKGLLGGIGRRSEFKTHHNLGSSPRADKGISIVS
jgi:ribosomal protein S10